VVTPGAKVVFLETVAVVVVVGVGFGDLSIPSAIVATTFVVEAGAGGEIGRTANVGPPDTVTGVAAKVKLDDGTKTS
jgi:hypothetical protein